MRRSNRVATIKENDGNSQPSKAKLNKKLAKQYINAVEDEYQKRTAKLDTDAFLFQVKTDLDKFVLNISQASANKTLAELQKEAMSLPSETISLKSVLSSTTKSGSKIPTLSRSRGHASTCHSRSSRSQVSIKKAKTTRLSKALTRAKVQHALTNNSNEPCALANKGYSSTYGLVTPKVKPHTSSVVLRRPKQGEMAISMQGSPLLVGSVINENVANVNIPLGDDRVISIQPNRGLRNSECPTLNEETRQQLQTLRDNLNTICNL